MNQSLIEIFKDIDDSRKGNALKYNLGEVLTIGFMTTLCDCSHFTQIELFEIERKNWLNAFLEFENGIPYSF